MNKKYLLLLFSSMFALLNLQNSNAQTAEPASKELLQKIDNAIDNIESIIYTIDHKRKFFSNRDTIHTVAVCSLFVESKNVMKIYNIIDLKLGKKYINIKYDKSNISWTNVSVDSLTTSAKPEMYKDKNTKRDIQQQYSYLYLNEYLMQKKPFGKYISSARLIGVTEEIYKGIPVYILNIAFKEQDGVSNNVEKHYIRKSDFLPIAFSSSMQWESMEQYNYYEVDYLAINPNLSLDDFKIDKNETINAEERYTVLKEKTKI